MQMQSGLWLGLPLPINLLSLKPGREKLTSPVSLLVVKEEGLDNEKAFSGLVPLMLNP